LADPRQAVAFRQQLMASLCFLLGRREAEAFSGLDDF